VETLAAGLRHAVDPGSPARDAFLVVYAVLWGGSTGSFGRLRAFTLSSCWAADRRIALFARRRFFVGAIVVNLGPVAVLALIWKLLPTGGAFGAVFGGALAGLSATAFPRFLHGVLASDEQWERFYTRDEWCDVMKRWDPVYFDDRTRARTGANSWRAHVLPGLLLLVVPSVLGALIARADASPLPLLGLDLAYALAVTSDALFNRS